MKKNNFVLFAVLFFISAFAQAGKYNYKNYWSQSDWVKADAKSSFKVLQKENLVLSGVVTATVTVTKDNSDSFEAVMALAKKSLKGTTWSRDQVDGLDIFETLDKTNGTIYRLAYNGKTKQFSMASVMARYALPSYLEAHQWQVELLTSKKATGKKSAFYEMFFQKAYAADFDFSGLIGDIGSSIQSAGNIGPSIDSAGARIGNGLSTVGNGVGKVGTGLESIGTNVGRVAGSVDNVAGGLNNAAGSVNNAAGSLDRAGNNVRAGMDNVAGSIDRAGSNARAGMDNVAGSVDRASQSVDRFTNKLNAKEVAKLSAVAGTVFGLTSSLSSMAAHFLVQGGYETLRTLFYEAKGEFKPEEKERRLARFKEAMQTFEKLTPQMNEIANKLTTYTLLMNYVSTTNGEDVLARLNAEINRKKSKTEGECAECNNDSAMNVKQLESLKALIEKTSGNKSDLEAAACKQLDGLYLSWKGAETNLSIARHQVIQDMALFNGSMIEGAMNNDRAFREQTKEQNTCGKSAAEGVRKIESQIKQGQCDSDFSTLICQRYEALKSAVESCQEAANIQVTEYDVTKKIQSASDFVRGMTNYSKELASMSCDPAKGNCKQGDLDKTRNDFQFAFKKSVTSCQSSFFAKEIQKRDQMQSAVAATPQVAPAQVPTVQPEKKCNIVLGCLRKLSEEGQARQAEMRLNNALYNNYAN